MKPSQTASEKVLVSLGSGLGSLVVAWLLKKQGRQLRGVYFDFIQDPVRTAWVQQIEKKLGIPVQILDVTEELESKVVAPWLEARKNGVNVSMRKLFQQAIMFPKLFELKNSYHFDKVATGHFAITQYDELEKVMRIMRSVEANRDEAEFLLGLTQAEIRGLELPLGSIPSSMSSRIADELALGEVEPIRTHPIWKRLQEFGIKSLGEDASQPYEVFNIAGEKIGSSPKGICYSIGDVWNGWQDIPENELELLEKHYVFKIDSKSKRIVIGTLKQRVIQKLNLKSLFWFVQNDLELKGLQCSMLWSNPSTSPKVKVLEYEGHCAKVFLEAPLKKDETDIFPGQTVLWLSGNEILGGAEVSSCE